MISNISTLAEIFGQNIDKVTMMLNMLKQTYDNYKVKVIMRHNYLYSNNIPLDIIQFILNNNHDIHEFKQFDDIEADLWVPIKSKSMTFTRNINTKNDYMINTIGSITTSKNIDTNCTFILNLYKEALTVVEDSYNIIQYKRNIGRMYTLDNLDNWFMKIYATIITDNKEKLYQQMDIDECFKAYTNLTVEFCLKEVTSSIEMDLMLLFERFYRLNYQQYSITYKMLCERSNNILSIQHDAKLSTSIPKDTLMCVYTNERFACTIINFNGKYYMLTNDIFKGLPLKDDLTGLSIFFCMYTTDETFTLIDVPMFQDVILTNLPYDKRIDTISNYLDDNAYITFDGYSKDILPKTFTKRSFIYYTPTTYYLNYRPADVSINFMVKRITNTHEYCLYVKANGKQLINDNMYYNNYSQQHFNYTITKASIGVYALFDNPYYDIYSCDMSLITEDVINTLPYSDVYKRKIMDFIKYIIANPNVIDTKVLSFTVTYYKKYYWIPLPDIDLNNIDSLVVDTYEYALLCCSVLYNNINDNIHITQPRSIDTIIKRYIAEKFIMPTDRMIDIADTYTVSHIYAKDVIVVSTSTNILINYVNNMLKEHEQYIPLMMDTRNSLKDTVNVKCLNKKLSLSTLLSIKSFISNTIDTVYIQYNTSYIFKNIPVTIRFMDMLVQCLSDNSKIVLEYYNDTLVQSRNVTVINPLQCTFKPNSFKIPSLVYLENNQEVRYKGNSVTLHNHDPNIPLIIDYLYTLNNISSANTISSSMRNMLNNICECFGVDLEYDTNLYNHCTKYFHSKVDISNYCNEAYSDTMFNDKQMEHGIMIRYSDDKMIEALIEDRYNKCKHPTIVIFDGYANYLEVVAIYHMLHIHNMIYVMLPSDINRPFLQDVIYNSVLYELTYTHLEDNIIIPMHQLIFKIFAAYGYVLDIIEQPYNSSFLTKYLGDNKVTTYDINKLKALTVASFINTSTNI